MDGLARLVETLVNPPEENVLGYCADDARRGKTLREIEQGVPVVDVRGKYVSPAIDQVSFNCPHCGALAKQDWFTAHAEMIRSRNETPRVLDAKGAEQLNLDHVKDEEGREKVKEWAKRMVQGRPFLQKESKYCDYNRWNVSLSRCFSCNEIALWVHERLLWPQRGEAPLANPDLPDDIRRDYDEASTILDLSPRGATALLRLGIQKLCKQLGQNGKDLNADIGALVKKGLDFRVQQALDVVRVVGNNAVHPGQIDICDDRATAKELFTLVNLIAEIMISQPKHISEMYASLPASALKGIERRDDK